MYLADKIEFCPSTEARGKDALTPDLDEVGRTLMRAAQRIRERGWCQGVASDSDGRVCLLGAIYDSPPGSEDCSGEGGAQRAAYYMVINGHGATWNDRPERTAADVIAALEANARARSALSKGAANG